MPDPFQMFDLRSDVVVSDVKSIQCCFTSTETVGLLGTPRPGTATSTFTQPLSSDVKSESYTDFTRLICPLSHQSGFYSAVADLA